MNSELSIMEMRDEEVNSFFKTEPGSWGSKGSKLSHLTRNSIWEQVMDHLSMNSERGWNMGIRSELSLELETRNMEL